MSLKFIYNIIMNINFNNKNVIIRVDFNVPIKNNKIENTLRIDKAMNTIERCIKDDPKRIVIISHLGRPNGKYVKDLSLKIVLPYLELRLGRRVGFGELEDINNISYKVILMENIRFYPEEESKEITSQVLEFRKKLTELGDIFINDAFGCCHRAHSSIVGINSHVKIQGYLVKNEVFYLKESFENGKKPILAMVGGSKVNDKIKLLENLIKKVDHLIIGGGMAFTFLKYYGLEIGSSLFDQEGFELVEQIIDSANQNKVKIHLPIDFKIADKFDNLARTKIQNISEGIPEGWMGLDIGPLSIEKFINIIYLSKTIVWNGPMGVFEFNNFANGSYQIAEEMITARHNGAITIIGGGDTASCVTKFGMQEEFNHLSTGGGVSLELLEGKELPGLKILENKKIDIFSA